MDTDYDDDNEQQDSSKLLRDLRKQIKALTAERDELRASHKTSVFEKAGFDPARGVGKLLAQHYDGELSVDAIRSFAQAEGIDVPETSDVVAAPPEQPEVAERQQFQDRLAQLRSSGDAGAATTTSWEDFRALRAENPAAALELLSQGRVDVPPHIAEQLQANDAERPLGAAMR